MSENLVRKSHVMASEFFRGKTIRWAVDATLGLGRDALFLASLLEKDGEVFGFDIQEKSIFASRELFKRMAPSKRLRAYLCCHSKMLEKIPLELRGKISCVFFNLGWMPCSDKSVVTSPESTVSALDASLKLLDASMGALSVLSYRGHDGGEAEFYAVSKFFNDNFSAENFDVVRCSDAPTSPVLFFARMQSCRQYEIS